MNGKSNQELYHYFPWVLGFRRISEPVTGSSTTCHIDSSRAREHPIWVIGSTKSPSPFSNVFHDISSQDTSMSSSPNSIARCWNAHGMCLIYVVHVHLNLSQTDHIVTATTCQQRLQFWGLFFYFYYTIDL